jgi:hypothetical protein
VEIVEAIIGIPWKDTETCPKQTATRKTISASVQFAVPSWWNDKDAILGAKMRWKISAKIALVYIHNGYDVIGRCSVFGTRVTRDRHEETSAESDLVSRFFAISGHRWPHVSLVIARRFAQ